MNNNKNLFLIDSTTSDIYELFNGHDRCVGKCVWSARSGIVVDAKKGPARYMKSCKRRRWVSAHVRTLHKVSRRALFILFTLHQWRS